MTADINVVTGIHNNDVIIDMRFVITDYIITVIMMGHYYLYRQYIWKSDTLGKSG